MGWTITPGAKRRDVIKERTTDYEDNTQRRECLARAVRGKVLWTVWEITIKRDGRTQRYIGCDILGTDGEGNYGYKDECESVGPCHYSCPLKFLRMVPEVACEGWRQKVREFHARTGQKIVLGQKPEPRGRRHPVRDRHQREAAQGDLPRHDLPHTAPLPRAAGRTGDGTQTEAGRQRRAR